MDLKKCVKVEYSFYPYCEQYNKNKTIKHNTLLSKDTTNGKRFIKRILFADSFVLSESIVLTTHENIKLKPKKNHKGVLKWIVI